MFTLAQVNIGANPASILGVFYLILAIAQFIFLQKTYKKYIFFQLIVNIFLNIVPSVLVRALLSLTSSIIMSFSFSKKNGIGILHFLFFANLPFILVLSGSILLFQGWRLDPILQFKDLLQFIVILYFSIKSLKITNDSSSETRSHKLLAK